MARLGGNKPSPGRGGEKPNFSKEKLKKSADNNGGSKKEDRLQQRSVRLTGLLNQANKVKEKFDALSRNIQGLKERLADPTTPEDVKARLEKIIARREGRLQERTKESKIDTRLASLNNRFSSLKQKMQPGV
jgi:hypothetical protein